MTHSSAFAPGEKTHRDENFPVASYVLAKKYRCAVLAFYRFARAADDIADHPELSSKDKITKLDSFEATLLGINDTVQEALPLRKALAEHCLSPRHAQDLLIAFRQDATKARYKDWDELMGYCAFSAAPVGRFILELHGENSCSWPASDALCSALQIINHLQDCQNDYLHLNRIYLPEESLARHSVPIEALAKAQSSQGLRQCIVELAERTSALINGASLCPQIRDLRLSLELNMIEKIAHRLLVMLRTRDPLRERVHLRKYQFIFILIQASLATIADRALIRRT